MQTMTFYPNADPETTSVDGYAEHREGGLTWAELIGSAGTASDDDSSEAIFVYMKSDTITDKWLVLDRGILLFDTSALPDNCTVTAATLYIYLYGKDDSLDITPDLNVYSSAPASNTAVVAGDFDSLGSTPFCDTPLTYANATTGQYHSFTLNAAGLAAISKTGITKLGLRNANYDVATSVPSWTSNKRAYFEFYTADKATAYRPKLIVTYETYGGYIWIEGAKFHFIDETNTEQLAVNESDVDDTPVNGVTTDPISSNWAYDHENSTSGHPALLITTAVAQAFKAVYNIASQLGSYVHGIKVELTRTADIQPSTGCWFGGQFVLNAGSSGYTALDKPAYALQAIFKGSDTNPNGVDIHVARFETQSAANVSDIVYITANTGTTIQGNMLYLASHINANGMLINVQSSATMDKAIELLTGAGASVNYGLDISRATINTADIRFSNSETISGLDDTAVNGATTSAISSNWAYDHGANASAHHTSTPGGLYGINVETLSDDKTLTPGTDKIYQYLDEGGDDRNITLDTASATAGDRFVIRHNGVYNDDHYLEVKQAAASLDRIYAGAIKGFIFNGTDWVPFTTGTGEEASGKYQVAIGWRAQAYEFGIAIGYDALGYRNGVAVGLQADGYDQGVAIGRGSMGYDFGVAIGYTAKGYGRGVAIGNYTTTNHERYSIALGQYSWAIRTAETTINIDGGMYQKNNVVQGRWAGTTEDDTPAEILLGARANERFTIRASSALAFKMTIVARDNVANEVAMYTIEDGLIKRDASNNTTMVNCTVTTVHEDDATWDVAVTADDTNEALIITVTGDADNPVQWAVRMDGVETHF